MRILMCHNFYQLEGGEDWCHRNELRLLRSAGHDVTEWSRHNDDIAPTLGVRSAIRAMWNRDTYRDVRRVIRKFCPDVIYSNNTFPVVSPSLYYAASREGVPVIQALHNYRDYCANGCLFRNGGVCTACTSTYGSWWGIVHGCYRQSHMASLAVTGVQIAHRIARVRNKIALFHTPTEFARTFFVARGIPADRIVVKPSFVDPIPSVGTGGGGFVLFVGRLTEEKGIRTALEAWQHGGLNVPLRIVGVGPLQDEIARASRTSSLIDYRGYLAPHDVLTEMANALCVVVPSRWYETFGRTMMESYAVGTPVIASRLGAMSEVVRDGETGLLARPGDAMELASAVESMLAQPSRYRQFRQNARAEFLSRYTPSKVLQTMESMLHSVVDTPMANV